MTVKKGGLRIKNSEHRNGFVKNSTSILMLQREELTKPNKGKHLSFRLSGTSDRLN